MGIFTGEINKFLADSPGENTMWLTLSVPDNYDETTNREKSYYIIYTRFAAIDLYDKLILCTK